VKERRGMATHSDQSKRGSVIHDFPIDHCPETRCRKWWEPDCWKTGKGNVC
jgi:hypothetical protein